jgi:hypothetical protein
MMFANVILVVHFLFVLFIVGGFGAIWIGWWLRWKWIRNSNFRIIHLGAMIFVAGESLLGYLCPLTVLEDMLRGGAQAQPPGFLQRWISHLLYYDFPGWIFTVTYTVFAIMIVATYFIVRPVSTNHHK